MLIIRKWIKWLVAIVLMVQLVSFFGYAASSILLQNAPIELVERVRSIETGATEFENTLNFERAIGSYKSFFLFYPSTFLVLSNKAYCLKLKTQNFQFFNTIKPPLLAKLLPLNPTIFFVKSS